jgi:hypothetical protein
MTLVRIKTLNVLELAGKGRVVNSYQDYKRRNRIRKMDILTVDKDVDFCLPAPRKMEQGMKISKIVADSYEFAAGGHFFYVPINCIRSPKYYLNFSPDHIHLNMMNGQDMDKPLAEKFFASISAMLKKGGLLFFSADHLIFKNRGRQFDAQDGPFTALGKIISANFEMVFQSYRENFGAIKAHGDPITHKIIADGGIPAIITPEAIGIAASFGYSLKSPQGIPNFFSLFSLPAEKYGAYFVIAKKKG